MYEDIKIFFSIVKLYTPFKGIKKLLSNNLSATK